MQGFESIDNLSHDLRGFTETEYSFLESSLIVGQISSIAIFQEQIVVIIILFYGVEFDDVWRVYCFHALDLSIQILL